MVFLCLQVGSGMNSPTGTVLGGQVNGGDTVTHWMEGEQKSG